MPRSSIASMSLGRAAAHSLPHKLSMARKYGFEGIELFFEDLEQIALSKVGGLTPANQLLAASEIRHLCDSHQLAIICLQPFWQYEGLLDRKEHEKRIEKMKLWIQLCKILGTDCIQIPGSFLSPEEITGDLDVIVQDLREVADLGATEGIKFAYESLAWSTFVDTWEKCWEVVQRVDRPNFGICLDTFNIAGRIYADPVAMSGKTPQADAVVKASVERLLKTVDRRKIFFVQVVDAERLDKPLIEGHEFYDAGQPARMSWSRNCRLFYGEKGGYLPVKQIAEAILVGLGFDGWVSAELFNRVMWCEDDDIPEQLALRGMKSWTKLMRDLDLEGSTTNSANAGSNGVFVPDSARL